eukprot:jgi/Bigna1/73554/fgenesh1_pg.24_\
MPNNATSSAKFPIKTLQPKNVVLGVVEHAPSFSAKSQLSSTPLLSAAKSSPQDKSVRAATKSAPSSKRVKRRLKPSTTSNFHSSGYSSQNSRQMNRRELSTGILLPKKKAAPSLARNRLQRSPSNEFKSKPRGFNFRNPHPPYDRHASMVDEVNDRDDHTSANYHSSRPDALLPHTEADEAAAVAATHLFRESKASSSMATTTIRVASSPIIIPGLKSEDDLSTSFVTVGRRSSSSSSSTPEIGNKTLGSRCYTLDESEGSWRAVIRHCREDSIVDDEETSKSLCKMMPSHHHLQEQDSSSSAVIQGAEVNTEIERKTEQEKREGKEEVALNRNEIPSLNNWKKVQIRQKAALKQEREENGIFNDDIHRSMSARISSTGYSNVHQPMSARMRSTGYRAPATDSKKTNNNKKKKKKLSTRKFTSFSARKSSKPIPVIRRPPHHRYQGVTKYNSSTSLHTKKKKKKKKKERSMYPTRMLLFGSKTVVNTPKPSSTCVIPMRKSALRNPRLQTGSEDGHHHQQNHPDYRATTRSSHSIKKKTIVALPPKEQHNNDDDDDDFLGSLSTSPLPHSDANTTNSSMMLPTKKKEKENKRNNQHSKEILRVDIRWQPASCGGGGAQDNSNFPPSPIVVASAGVTGTSASISSPSSSCHPSPQRRGFTRSFQPKLRLSPLQSYLLLQKTRNDDDDDDDDDDDKQKENHLNKMVTSRSTLVAKRTSEEGSESAVSPPISTTPSKQPSAVIQTSVIPKDDQEDDGSAHTRRARNHRLWPISSEHSASPSVVVGGGSSGSSIDQDITPPDAAAHSLSSAQVPAAARSTSSSSPLPLPKQIQNPNEDITNTSVTTTLDLMKKMKNSATMKKTASSSSSSKPKIESSTGKNSSMSSKPSDNNDTAVAPAVETMVGKEKEEKEKKKQLRRSEKECHYYSSNDCTTSLTVNTTSYENGNDDAIYQHNKSILKKAGSSDDSATTSSGVGEVAAQQLLVSSMAEMDHFQTYSSPSPMKHLSSVKVVSKVNDYDSQSNDHINDVLKEDSEDKSSGNTVLLGKNRILTEEVVKRDDDDDHPIAAASSIKKNHILRVPDSLSSPPSSSSSPSSLSSKQQRPNEEIACSLPQTMMILSNALVLEIISSIRNTSKHEVRCLSMEGCLEEFQRVTQWAYAFIVDRMTPKEAATFRMDLRKIGISSLTTAPPAAGPMIRRRRRARRTGGGGGGGDDHHNDRKTISSSSKCHLQVAMLIQKQAHFTSNDQMRWCKQQQQQQQQQNDDDYFLEEQQIMEDWQKIKDALKKNNSKGEIMNHGSLPSPTSSAAGTAEKNVISSKSNTRQETAAGQINSKLSAAVVSSKSPSSPPAVVNLEFEEALSKELRIPRHITQIQQQQHLKEEEEKRTNALEQQGHRGFYDGKISDSDKRIKDNEASLARKLPFNLKEKITELERMSLPPDYHHNHRHPHTERTNVKKYFDGFPSFSSTTSTTPTTFKAGPKVVYTTTTSAAATARSSSSSFSNLKLVSSLAALQQQQQQQQQQLDTSRSNASSSAVGGGRISGETSALTTAREEYNNNNNNNNNGPSARLDSNDSNESTSAISSSEKNKIYAKGISTDTIASIGAATSSNTGSSAANYGHHKSTTTTSTTQNTKLEDDHHHPQEEEAAVAAAALNEAFKGLSVEQAQLLLNEAIIGAGGGDGQQHTTTAIPPLLFSIIQTPAATATIATTRRKEVGEAAASSSSSRRPLHPSDRDYVQQAHLKRLRRHRREEQEGVRSARIPHIQTRRRNSSRDHGSHFTREIKDIASLKALAQFSPQNVTKTMSARRARPVDVKQKERYKPVASSHLSFLSAPTSARFHRRPFDNNSGHSRNTTRNPWLQHPIASIKYSKLRQLKDKWKGTFRKGKHKIHLSEFQQSLQVMDIHIPMSCVCELWRATGTADQRGTIKLTTLEQKLNGLLAYKKRTSSSLGAHTESQIDKNSQQSPSIQALAFSLSKHLIGQGQNFDILAE